MPKQLRTSTQNLVRYSFNCEVCAARFGSSRPDARFCSHPCRQRAYRDALRDRKQREEAARRERQTIADNAAVQSLRDQIESAQKSKKKRTK